MFNLKARGSLADPKDAGKPALKPALYDPPGSVPRASAGVAPRPAAPAQAVAPPREGQPAAPAFPLRDDVYRAAAPTPAPRRRLRPRATEPPGSKLFVGVNIKLKGVEISDCDVMVIEGQVEATVHSKVMQIAKPGTLRGTAQIDVAEIHGEFTGELTARTRLVVHGTGRVSGTIRYGQLIVAEGSEQRRQADGSPGKHVPHSRVATPDSRSTPHTRGTNGDDAARRRSRAQRSSQRSARRYQREQISLVAHTGDAAHRLARRDIDDPSTPLPAAPRDAPVTAVSAVGREHDPARGRDGAPLGVVSVIARARRRFRPRSLS
jgi:cytoskeletal protein CcmA (bactofilin family)